MTSSETAAADLCPSSLSTLDWSPGKETEAVAHVFQHVMAQAEAAINWYLKGKQRKRAGASNIRVLAIVLGTAAAFLPTVGELLISQWGEIHIGTGWTVVLLGVAGALLLMDRFYGFTSGWMRYIVAELQIRQIRDEFQLDLETERASWGGRPRLKSKSRRRWPGAKWLVVAICSFSNKCCTSWQMLNRLTTMITPMPTI